MRTLCKYERIVSMTLESHSWFGKTLSTSLLVFPLRARKPKNLLNTDQIKFLLFFGQKTAHPRLK